MESKGYVQKSERVAVKHNCQKQVGPTSEDEV